MENKKIEPSKIQKLLNSLEASKKSLMRDNSIWSINNRDEKMQEYMAIEEMTKNIRLYFSDYRRFIEEEQIVFSLLREFEITFKNSQEIKVIVENLRKTFISKQNMRKKRLDEKLEVDVEKLKEYVKQHHYRTLDGSLLDDKYIDIMIKQNKSNIDYDVFNSATYKFQGFSGKIKTTSDKKLDDFNKYKITSSKQSLSQKLFDPMSLQIKKVGSLLKENANIDYTISALNVLEEAIKKASYRGLSLTATDLLIETIETIKNTLYKRIDNNDIELSKIDAYQLAKENQKLQEQNQRRVAVITGYKELYLRLLKLNENVYENASKIDEMKMRQDDYANGNRMTSEEVEQAKIAAENEYYKHSKTQLNSNNEHSSTTEKSNKQSGASKTPTSTKNTNSTSDYRSNNLVKTQINHSETPISIPYQEKTLDQIFQKYANFYGNSNVKYDMVNYFKDYIKICKEQQKAPNITDFAKYLVSSKGMNNLPDDLKQQVYEKEIENLKQAGLSEVIPDSISINPVNKEPLAESQSEAKKNFEDENYQKWFDMHVEQARLKVENVCKYLSKQLGVFNFEYYHQIIMDYINRNYTNLNFEDLVNNMFMIFKEYGLNMDYNELMKSLEAAKADYLMIELKADFSNITHSEEEIQQFLKSLIGSVNNDLKR